MLITATTGSPFSTSGLTAKIRRALRALNADHNPARVRSIDPRNAEYYARLARRVAGAVEDGDIAATLTAFGGIVPNSYRYRAAGDVLLITITADGYTVMATRGHAPKRPYGRGRRVTGRILKADQTIGRLALYA